MQEINHETYVSFEVAKLLKEAGFDWKQYSFYNSKGILINGTFAANWNDKIWYIDGNKVTAPTLNVAQRWLREVKECAVIVETHNVQAACVSAYVYCIYPTDAAHPCEHINGFAEEQCFDTYEEAQEAGIKEALEMISEKGKRGYGI